MRYPVFFLISSIFLFSNEVDHHLSLQGYTGLINTPNAEILNEGDMVIHFNNQFDNHLRNYDYDVEHESKEDYQFGVGFLSSLEVVGRLVESKGILRDLSANLKYKVPYTHEYLPNIAVGLQDIGGAASFYENRYIVLDKEIGAVKGSIGYGQAKDGIHGKRMDGLFGGMEFQATNWFSIMAEHDGEENHAAVRIAMPSSWLSNVDLDVMLTQNLTEADTSFAFNFSIPFLSKNEKRVPLETTLTSIDEGTLFDLKENSLPLKVIDLNEKKEHTLLDLQNSLVKFGFENVRVGTDGDETLYVECENTIFNHNDLDALGYILGQIIDTTSRYNYYQLTLLTNNLQTISLGGTLAVYKKYMNFPNIRNLNNVKEGLVITNSYDISRVNFITKQTNSSFFRPRLELSPGVITAVGTEVGVLDYLVSLQSNVYVPLYDGLIASAMYEVPLFHSNDFDEGEVYHKIYEDRIDKGLVNFGLHQTLHYDTLFNTTSIGQFNSDFFGVMNQTYFSSDSGEHAMKMRLGGFENKDGEQRDVYLGSYRYFYAPLDMFTELTYGKYWNQDNGITLTLKRFFGDTATSFYLKDMGYNKYAGINVSFPLTFKKLYKASTLGQVKGKKDFSYGLKTTVNLDDGSNQLKPSGGIIPKTEFELDSYYLNRDRLNASYIKEHIDRMREAYFEYTSN